MIHDSMVIFEGSFGSLGSEELVLFDVRTIVDDNGIRKTTESYELVFILALQTLRIIYNFLEISGGAGAGRRGR